MVEEKDGKTDKVTKIPKTRKTSKKTGTPQKEIISLKQGTIQGKVQYSDGSPRAGLTVKAFDRSVAGDDTPLGQAVTRKNGSYAVNYPLEKLGGKAAGDLVLRVYRDDTLLQESEVIFNVKQKETKDFTFPVEVSPEFKRLSETIQPLLQEKIDLAGLTKNQINFLATKTGFEARKIERLAEAKKRSAGDETLAAFNYALLYQDYPTDPSLLLGRDRTQIVRTIRLAEAIGAILPLQQEELDYILDTQLPRLRAENLLKPAGKGEKASLGDLLGTIPKDQLQSLSEDHKFAVADVIGQHGIDYAKLPAQLEKKGLESSQITTVVTTVERTLRLGDLTRRHLPLMSHLQEIAKDDPDGSLKSLVKIRRDHWIDKAYVYGVPAESGLSPEAYAKQLELAVEELHPTAALAAKLTNGLSAIRYPDVEEAGISVAKFINDNPTFDILKSDIPSFIKKAKLDGIDDKDLLQGNLLRFQRLRKMQATWGESFALWNAGMGSALDVVNAGRDYLLRQTEGDSDPERVAVIYDAAVQMHNLSLALMVNLMPRFSPTHVAAMGMSNRLLESSAPGDPSTEKADISPADDDPTLRALMGTLDYCECSDCQSVLSPAAYFVDLLQFLKPGPGELPVALSELLNRRPDLVDLELSCNNTHIEIPYIDLVLEILENAVAFPYEFNGTLQSVGQKPLPKEIRDSLQNTVLDVIGDNLTASRETKPMVPDELLNVWIITDKNRRWALKVGEGRVSLKLRFPRRLDQKLPDFPGSTDILNLIKDLDKGKISSEFIRALERTAKSIYGNYFYISKSEVALFRSSNYDRIWMVNCQLSINVSIILNHDVGTLTLKNPDNNEVFSGIYGLKTCIDIIKNLSNGDIPELLQDFLPKIPQKYNKWVPITSQSTATDYAGSIQTIATDPFPIDIILIFAKNPIEIISLTYQTAGKSEDLKTIPGNQNPLAYQILHCEDTSFPWSLPFDLPLETVRALLSRAGITRRQLIELAKPETYLDDPTIVHEVLGLSASEAGLITDAQTVQPLQRHWGVDKFNPDKKTVTIFDASQGKEVTKNPLNLLKTVSILIQQARISYDELQKIIQTDFVQTASRKSISIMPTSEDATCDLSKMVIPNLLWSHLDRIHRFIRLWRKLGWEIDELDLAIIALHPKQFGRSEQLVINTELLKRISHIKRLQDKLDLPVKILISWCGTSKTFLYRPYTLQGQPERESLYEQVFLNPLVKNPPDEAFILKSDRSDLQSAGKTLSEKTAVISAALGIRQEDFSQLVSQLVLTDKVTLANLFKVYRTTSLMKALGISVADYFRIQQITEYSPFTSTADLIKFCEAAVFIQDSGFSVDALSYLLQHNETPGSPLVLTDDKAAQMLTGIRSELQAKITSLDNQVRDLLRNNPPGLIVKKELSTIYAAVLADKEALTLNFTNPGDNASSVTDKIILLPISPGPNGSSISWSSSNSGIITINLPSNTASVRRPAFTAGSVNVTLTATLTNGAGAALVSDTQNFSLTVIREDPSYDEKADVDLKALTIGFGPGDNASGVTQNLTLPINGFLGSDIKWRSSDTNLINVDLTGSNTFGNAYVTRPAFSRGDQPVTLTAFIDTGATPTPSRDFVLNLIQQPEIDTKALAADLDALSIGFTNDDDDSSHVTGNLTLTPSPGPNGSIFLWTSSDTTYIKIDPNGDTSSVIRPAFTSGDVTVILTATATKKTATHTTLSAARDFSLTVRRHDPNADTAAKADVDVVTIGFAPGDSSSHVTKDLVLPIKGPYGSWISWFSSNDKVIKIDNTVGVGAVFRPDFTTGDTSVTLKATAPSTSGRPFDSINNLTVIKQTDAEAVAADLAALKLGDDAPNVTQTLTLPSSPGPNGSTITWSIPSQSYISLQNNQITVLQKPSDKDVSIPLYATVQKGSAKAVKIFSSDNFLDKDLLDTDRLTIVLSDLDIRTQLYDVVVNSVANLFSLEMVVAREMLVTDQPKTALLKKNPSEISLDAIDVFIDPSFIGSDIKAPPGKINFPDAYHLMCRLRKTAALLSTLNVKPAEIAWLHRQQFGMKALNFNDLPVERTTSGIPNLFRAWQQLVILFQLRDRSRGMGTLLTNYGTALSLAIPEAQKVIVTGLKLARDMTDPAILEAVTALDGIASEILGITTLDNYREPLKVKQLMDLLLVMKRLGANKDQVVLLTSAWPDPINATMAERTARDLLRAKYGEKSWHEIIKPVSNALRARQRDAVVDYLVARKGLRDANELYEHYLIDSQMSPCMLTSRLVQATAAVQLFVQRCLLNLEDQVSPDHIINRPRWEWMKNYRVWEANRKVFLFPENWLHPELRDDKTQTFSELQSGLSQGEPTYQLGKENLLTYMDNIAELMNMKVLGMCEEHHIVNQTIQSTLYIVGRTPNQPYRYFWRKCERFGESSMYWAGWERVDLNLSGDHIMPFTLKGDFYIAWPIISKVKSENTQADRWKVQLGWAQYTRKGWSNKKVGKEADAFLVDCQATNDETKEFTFRAIFDPGNMDSVNFAVFNTKTKYDSPQYPIPYTFYPDDQWEEPEVESHGEFGYAALFWEQLEIDGKVPGNRTALTVPFAKFVFTLFFDYVTPDGKHLGKSYAYNQTVLITYYYSHAKEGNPPFSKTDVMTYKKSDSSLQCWYEAILDYGSFESGEFQNFLRRVKFTLRMPEEDYGMQLWSYDPYKVMELQSCSYTYTIKAPSHLEMKEIGHFILSASNDFRKTELEGRYWFWTPISTKIEIDANGFRGTGSLSLQTPDPSTPEIKIFQYTPLGDTGFSIVQSTEPIKILKAYADPQDPIWYGDQIWYYEDSLMKLYLKVEWMLANFDPCWLAVTDGIQCTGNLRTHSYTDIDRFYSPDLQKENDQGIGFKDTYKVIQWGAPWVMAKSRIEKGINFDLSYPSALYNWEIFYHSPMLIAEFLIKQQRFEDAEKWLHYIFNPRTTEPVDTTQSNKAVRFWQFYPFRQATDGETLGGLFELLAKGCRKGSLSDEDLLMLLAFRGQIENWEINPFLPHSIARSRQSAYQWRTIFSYLDYLIAWGDQMFRRNTRESIIEAILLYVMAAKLLGPRPKSIRHLQQPRAQSYRDLDGKWDEFSNAWYGFMDCLPNQAAGTASPGKDGQIGVLTSIGMLYFCIPHNDKLLSYWDKVEDRLFKIRNCMNIEGIVQQIPLFAPPIDPELLVRATAAGLDIATVLADMGAPLLPYRWNVLLQKANEICNEVKSMGAALLSALEKQDAEALALMRSDNEIALLNLVTLIKEKQVKEATANLDVLNQNKTVVLERFFQYQHLLGKPAVSLDQDGLPILEITSSLQVAANAPGDVTGLGLIQYEVDQLSSLEEANKNMKEAGLLNTIAATLHIIPESVAILQFGGMHLGNAAGARATYLNMLASEASHVANKKSLFSQYQRRQDEWVHQSKLALEEMKQIKKQIIAAEIRQAIAQKELDNHTTQIEQAKSIDEFMHDKYTNKELYSWMVGEISTVYFQAYQLAYDMAKRAERAFQNELGIENTTFINFGYWDGLKKGLLAGENLSLDLKRMEVAYLEQNKRELEITRHVSLLQLDPIALIKLKETGSCEVSFPEALFDLDCPGHYFRRIKSVSITIPCIVGPYTSVNCTLTLKKHSYRKTPMIGLDGYPHRTDTDRIPADDNRFVEGLYGINQSIVTSSAQNDSGLFELNFRDERYLPFEGTGVISTWEIALPKFRQFDYHTISDVILHIHYTARHDGALAEKVSAELKKELTTLMQLADGREGLARLFSLRHEFANEWYRFARNTSGQNAPLSIEITHERFPFFCQGHTIRISTIDVIPAQRTAEGIRAADPDELPVMLNNWDRTGSNKIMPGKPGVTVQLSTDASPADIEDIILICHYTVDIK